MELFDNSTNVLTTGLMKSDLGKFPHIGRLKSEL
jgi:hypothetical protein